MSPLHVLEVVGNAIVGGMESWVERFVEQMPRERYRFTVLLPADGPYADRLRALGAEVVIVMMADDPPWVSIQTAVALVQHRGIDLIHGHLPRAHVLAGLVGRLTGRPVVATVHGRQPSVLDMEVHRTTGTHLSVVCQASYLSALGLGVSPAQLSCEPNGVDTRRFHPRPRGGLRASLGLAADAALLGFVGRLSPEKGPEVFLRVCGQLAGRGVQAQAVIVGDGPMHASLQRQAAELGLAGRLHFLGLRDDVDELYGELDVLVSSSHAEAMPLAVMEGMASGLPVIATRVGGVPELVAHGETGWLVAPGDCADMAARCAALLADAPLRRRLGDAARRRAVERFDLRDGLVQLDRLLTRLARPETSQPLSAAAAA
jgi:glycosyltransferase involved in cell wall biosynthesis